MFWGYSSQEPNKELWKISEQYGIWKEINIRSGMGLNAYWGTKLDIKPGISWLVVRSSNYYTMTLILIDESMKILLYHQKWQNFKNTVLSKAEVVRLYHYCFLMAVHIFLCLWTLKLWVILIRLIVLNAFYRITSLFRN